MAQPGGNKDRSIDHENYIAHKYRAKRSKSSGASVMEKGDVRNGRYIIECKTTGQPGSPAKSTLVRQMEKVADEARSEAKEPVIALRFFMPASPLSNPDGWVDLSVRLTQEDAQNVWELDNQCCGSCDGECGL